ncbi:MAG TPA: hypothetical protein VM802_20540 [Chitinophaga sp.]|uniref:hypothetical protein n=1 Tax=Chitinophaga sp. TaxID=1869181 RepID=UPI002BEC24C1|nr:hypothetical protein [Chitinophaga sp.]HVI47278.1 hypothetical protein [Chitinophaga sp.]
MAKQTSILTFTGKLGNLIGYSRNGKYFVRSMPAKVRQTAATCQAAHRFGRASQTGALIRRAFSRKLDVNCDSGHINRLTSTLVPSAGNDIPSTTAFRFNRHTGTHRFLDLAPKLSQDGILCIPPQALAACNGMDALEIKVIAARINFATRQVVGTESAVLTVQTGESFKGAACNMNVPGKGILVVVLQIRGIKDGFPSHNRKYQAADIIAVQLPQMQQGLRRKFNPKQQKLRQLPEKNTRFPINQAFPSTHSPGLSHIMPASSPPLLPDTVLMLGVP